MQCDAIRELGHTVSAPNCLMGKINYCEAKNELGEHAVECPY